MNRSHPQGQRVSMAGVALRAGLLRLSASQRSQPLLRLIDIYRDPGVTGSPRAARRQRRKRPVLAGLALVAARRGSSWPPRPAHPRGRHTHLVRGQPCAQSSDDDLFMRGSSAWVATSVVLGKGRRPAGLHQNPHTQEEVAATRVQGASTGECLLVPPSRAGTFAAKTVAGGCVRAGTVWRVGAET